MYSAATPLRPPSLHDALPIYIQALDSKGLRQRRRYAGIFCPNFILKTLSSGLALPGNRTEGSLVQREALERSPCAPEVGVTAEPLAGPLGTASRPPAAGPRSRDA